MSYIEHQRLGCLEHPGDLSGFYFPLRMELGLLRVNKQMRSETLPLSYSRTEFHLTDLDALIRLLSVVGEIGRENIESLYTAWEAERTNQNPDDEGFRWQKLVETSVQLLNQCTRLKCLHLWVDKMNFPKACKALRYVVVRESLKMLMFPELRSPDCIGSNGRS